jgi:hypothetical protein
VTRKFLEPGDLASPDRAIFAMEDSSLLQLEIHVAEAMAGSITLGSKFRVEVGGAGAEIEGFVEDLNAKRPKNNRITYWSLRNHAERHFNTQDPANAARRRILERRKAQAADEFGDAAGHLLSGMAYLDVVAQKGWENLIDDNTVVDYETGLKAQLKLEELARDGAVEEQIAEMRRDVSIIQQAVKDVCTPAIMAQIVERIDELKGTVRDEAIEAEVIDDDDDDIGYDPVLSSDANDSLGED